MSYILNVRKPEDLDLELICREAPLDVPVIVLDGNGENLLVLAREEFLGSFSLKDQSSFGGDCLYEFWGHTSAYRAEFSKGVIAFTLNNGKNFPTGWRGYRTSLSVVNLADELSQAREIRDQPRGITVHYF